MTLGNGDGIQVTIDVYIGKAPRSFAKIFSTYIEVVDHDKVSILTPSLDHVTEQERSIIWKDILVRHCLNFLPYYDY